MTVYNHDLTGTIWWKKYVIILDLLKMTPNATGTYIGATDFQEEGKFISLTTGQHLTYTNWKQSEPNNVGN